MDAAGLIAADRAARSMRAVGSSGTTRIKEDAQSDPQPIWMETEARVIESYEEFPGFSRLPPQIIKATGHMIVSFTYYAHAQIYYDSFKSPQGLMQGEAFPVYCNALNPRQNTLTPLRFVHTSALSDTAVLGFFLLSILFLTMAPG